MIGVNAKYLGVYLGPACGSASWSAPLVKFVDRVKYWAMIRGLQGVHQLGLILRGAVHLGAARD